jgi:hypothetical protein
MAVLPADIAGTLGRPAPADGSALFTQWELWIGDARRIIKARLGDLDALDQEDLDFVVREAVAEKVRHGDGSTSETVTVDDGTVTKRWENGVTSQIDILDAWWALLTPATMTPARSPSGPYAKRERCW